MTDERKIMESLLVDEHTLLEDLKEVVNRAKNIFRIESHTGRIVFMNFGELNNSQRILVLLTGRHFAVKFGLIEDSSFGSSEIAKNLGIPKTNLSVPIKNLCAEKYIERLSNRKYRINHNRVNDIFDIYFDQKTVGA